MFFWKNLYYSGFFLFQIIEAELNLAQIKKRGKCWNTGFKNPVLVWLQALLNMGAKRSTRTQSFSLHCLAMLSSVLIPPSGKPSPIAADGCQKFSDYILFFWQSCQKKKSYFPTVSNCWDWLRFAQCDPRAILGQEDERHWMPISPSHSQCWMEPGDDFSSIKTQSPEKWRRGGLTKNVEVLLPEEGGIGGWADRNNSHFTRRPSMSRTTWNAERFYSTTDRYWASTCTLLALIYFLSLLAIYSVVKC